MVDISTIKCMYYYYQVEAVRRTRCAPCSGCRTPIWVRRTLFGVRVEGVPNHLIKLDNVTTAITFFPRFLVQIMYVVNIKLS